ncbi:hypothetical protein KWB77_003551 [Vibrio cholerae]|nr:hypothetical protein [Vibrio cholerae]
MVDKDISDPETRFLLKLILIVEHLFTTTLVLSALVSFLLVCWILGIDIDRANHLYTYVSESPIGYTISALIGFLGISYFLILKVLHKFVNHYYWSKFEEELH